MIALAALKAHWPRQAGFSGSSCLARKTAHGPRTANWNRQRFGRTRPKAEV